MCKCFIASLLMIKRSFYRRWKVILLWYLVVAVLLASVNVNKLTFSVVGWQIGIQNFKREMCTVFVVPCWVSKFLSFALCCVSLMFVYSLYTAYPTGSSFQEANHVRYLWCHELKQAGSEAFDGSCIWLSVFCTLFSFVLIANDAVQYTEKSLHLAECRVFVTIYSVW